jgi:1,2-phenylacetyl-CoA epoxidase catalytic subunit
LVLDAVSLTDAERGQAIASWQGRMVSEYVSARVFAELVPQAMRAALSYEQVEALTRMASEEVRHAGLCAEVVRALGGEARGKLPEHLPDVPTHRDADPLEALLRNVLSVSCCSETVAVALVGSERELSATPELASLLQEILSDEVGHARFGWRLLETTAASLTAAQKRRLSAHLVTVFRHQLSVYAPLRGLPSATDAALSVGAMDGVASFRVVAETLEAITVPGLERHGLEAAHAFREAVAGV